MSENSFCLFVLAVSVISQTLLGLHHVRKTYNIIVEYSDDGMIYDIMNKDFNIWC